MNAANMPDKAARRAAILLHQQARSASRRPTARTPVCIVVVALSLDTRHLDEAEFAELQEVLQQDLDEMREEEAAARRERAAAITR